MTTKNKSILISIHPAWCDKIAVGFETIEIRKTKPKLTPPFKCYIYMTSGGWEYRDPWCTAIAPIGGKIYNGAKKVVGEFICDKIDEISVFEAAITVNDKQDNEILRKSCLSFEELKQYIGYKYGTKLYGWHISNVIIYEKPKNLNDFERWEDGDEDIRPCQNGKHCKYEIFDQSEMCNACSIDFSGDLCPYYKVQRAPQSWCYVFRKP